jgi:hypothetical protein
MNDKPVSEAETTAVVAPVVGPIAQRIALGSAGSGGERAGRVCRQAPAGGSGGPGRKKQNPYSSSYSYLIREPVS